MSIYKVTSDETGFKVGTWIVKNRNKLFVVADKKTMQGAKLVGFLKLFKQWIKFKAVEEVEI